MPIPITRWKCLTCGHEHDTEEACLLCEEQGEPRAMFKIGQRFRLTSGREIQIVGTYIRYHMGKDGKPNHLRMYRLENAINSKLSQNAIKSKIATGLYIVI